MGIQSKNREEWYTTQIAGWRNGYTTVPLYEPYNEDTLEAIMGRTELSIVFIEKKHLPKYVHLSKEGRAGTLKTLVCFDELTEQDKASAAEASFELLQYEELKQAVESKPDYTEPTTNMVAIFVFTSGTTGEPKAAMLTHFNMMAMLESGDTNAILTNHDTVHLSYLPAAHIFEQAVFNDCVNKGYRLGFFRGDPTKLIDDAQALKPTLFCGVPRVLNRIYDKVMDGVSKAPPIKQWLFNRAVSVKVDNYMKTGSLDDMLYDALVFKKIKALLGGRVSLIVTGSAPITKEVLNFLKVALGAIVYEVYG